MMTRFSSSILTALLLIAPTCAQLGGNVRRRLRDNDEAANESEAERRLALNMGDSDSSFSPFSSSGMSSGFSSGGMSSGMSSGGMSSGMSSGFSTGGGGMSSMNSGGLGSLGGSSSGGGMSSMGGGMTGGTGLTFSGGTGSSDVVTEHYCDMTITYEFQGMRSCNIKVKNTNKVSTVETEIEECFGGIDIPSLEHFFVGNGECDADDELRDCGVCEHADSAITVEIAQTANGGFSCQVQSETKSFSGSSSSSGGQIGSAMSSFRSSSSSSSSGSSSSGGMSGGLDIGDLSNLGGMTAGSSISIQGAGSEQTINGGDDSRFSGFSSSSSGGSLGMGGGDGSQFSGFNSASGGGDLTGEGVTTSVRHNGRVKVRYGEQIITLSDIWNDDTIGTIKKRLESKTDLEWGDMRLTYNGVELSKNSDPIKSYDYSVIKTPLDILVLEDVSEERERNFRGGAKGDPHFVMWNGRKFDFHGGCDLVLVDDPTFDDHAGIKIHVRTKVVRWFSYVDSVVVQIGKDTLEVAGGFEQRRYWVNGERGEFVKKNGPMPFTIGGKQVRFQVMRNNISFQFKIVLDAKTKEGIILRAVKDYMRIDMEHPHKDLFADSVGLMGGFSDMEDKMLARDAVTVLDNVNVFGQEWQVRDDEPMLFHEAEGPQYPELCEMPSEDRIERRRLESSISKEEAEAACKHVDAEERAACVMDVVATGDIDIAEAY